MYSMLKTTFQKEEPKILIYRYFKKFTYIDFQSHYSTHVIHVNKTLHFAIMKCFQLKIKVMKSKSKNDVIEYKK